MNHLKLIARIQHPTPEELANKLQQQKIQAKLTRSNLLIVDLPVNLQQTDERQFLIPSLIAACTEKKILIACAEHRHPLTPPKYEDIVFCTTDGKKLSPYFVPRGPQIKELELSNALFSVPGVVFSVQCLHPHKQIILTKHHLSKIKTDCAHLRSIIIWEGYHKQLPHKWQRFERAIEAARQRSNHSCCLTPFFAN